MSLDASKWAWQLEIKPTKKIILLSMADRCGEDFTCWPSIARLEKDTQLNRKTIQKNISEMIDDGLVEDTGQRKGSTLGVRVLRLVGVKSRVSDPNNSKSDPKNGMTKRSQKRDTESLNLESTKEPIDALSRFSEFWDLYDKKKDKSKVERKWKRLTKKQKDKIFEVLPNYIKQTPDKQYRKNALTWLNGECWDDEDIQPKQQSKSCGELSLTDWEARAFKVGIGRYAGKHTETVEQYINRVKGAENG